MLFRNIEIHTSNKFLFLKMYTSNLGREAPSSFIVRCKVAPVLLLNDHYLEQKHVDHSVIKVIDQVGE